MAIDLLGVSPSGYSRAFNVNDTGVVVGESTASGHVQAVLWQVQDDSSSVYPTLLPGIGDGASTARDVNNGSVIVGQASEVSSQPHAVVWTPTDAGFAVHDLGPGWAGGISESDERGIIWVAGSTNGRPKVWTIDVTGQVLSVIDLAPTLAVYMSASANDVAVVGSTVRVAGTMRDPISNTAVFWDLSLDGTIIAETEFPGAAPNANISNSTEGIGVSARGDVVGRAKFGTEAALQGFLFSGSAHTFGSLGSLGNEGSLATSVTRQPGSGTDDTLWIAGHYFDRDKRSNEISAAAFVWENGLMTDLYGQLSNQGQWQELTFAWDINDRGDVVGSGIVGKGFSAHEQAYLALRISDGGNDRGGEKGNGDPRKLLARSASADVTAQERTTNQIEPLLHQALSWFAIPHTGHMAGWGEIDGNRRAFIAVPSDTAAASTQPAAAAESLFRDAGEQYEVDVATLAAGCPQGAKWASIDAAVVEWALSKKKW